MRQAKAGRIVMSVDCTDLLNRRHFDPLGAKDSLYLTDYPENPHDERCFDEVTVHTHVVNVNRKSEAPAIAIVTYGNGVPTATNAVIEMLKMSSTEKQFSSISIIDSPYLSNPPQQLIDLLQSKRFDAVLFADICKEGPGMPFAGIAASLQKKGSLSVPWQAIGAQQTYNPLGNLLTFLSTTDICEGIQLLVKNKK